MQRPLILGLLFALALVQPARAQAPADPPARAAPVDAEAFRVASERVIATVEAIAQVEGASPAMSVIMVRRGQAPVIWVHGPLDVRAEAQANADTPFYIASQTKAFVGLMALRLHARGVFSLDQSLADVWPDLTLPEGADARAITFRQLLSHQGVIVNETLSSRTADTDRVRARDYPRLLSTYSTVREPGFRYANLGYLIYGAALETRTGRDWRPWLDAEILRPAGLTRTSSRTSRFPRGQLPHHHQWLGGADWFVREGKPDATMHAAGGLVMSSADMSRWLSLQLGEAPDVVSADVLRQSQTVQIADDIQADVLSCQGYAIGWYVCRIGAADVLAHGGAYSAVRSSMAVSPDLGVGFAFMSNSDSLTGGLSQLLVQIFFETIQNAEWDGPPPDAIATQLGPRLVRLVDGRRGEVAARRAEAQWEGWAWRPSRSDLRRYAGHYRSARMGEFVISVRNGALHARLGATQAALEPAKADLFGFAEGPLDPPAPFSFERTDGRIVALTWDEERFERVR